MWREELPGLFRIEVPLPGNPLRSLNSYLVRGSDRSLLVDNGFNMDESRQALEDALAELEPNYSRLDFLITHLHSDHNGLTHHFCTPQSKIFCSRKDGEHINAFITDPQLWVCSLANLGLHGFPEDQLKILAESHPGKIYASKEALDFTWVEDNEVLDYGNYSLRVIFTPGHTPGQICLYEQKNRFLISGDHILGTITPNITCWRGVEDSLGDYLKNLDKVDNLDVQVSYPGHRAIIPDTHARIAALRTHHANRLKEAYEIVKKEKDSNAWNVASQMRWSLRGSWPEYGVNQKCFATGEAVAHLDHLVKNDLLKKRINDNGKFVYVYQ